MIKATREAVIEKIRQVFPERKVADVLAHLDRYGAEDYHREKARVQLAILKLCDEKGCDDPANYVATACADLVAAGAVLLRQRVLLPPVA